MSTRPSRKPHRSGHRRRSLRPARLLAALAAGVALTAFLAPAATASGAGPTWTNEWTGNGSAAGTSVAGVWHGTPAYTSFPGSSDGNDQGFSFDGSNYVAGPPALGNFGSDDFLINLVVKTTQADSFTHDLVSTRSTCAGGPFWQVFVSGAGLVTAQFYGTDGVGSGLTNPTAVNDGQPHNLNISRSGTTLTLNVDGNVVTTTAGGTGNYTTVDQHLNLGGGDGCGGVSTLRPFVGAVDYLYVQQGNDPAGQDLSLGQASTPTVAAGDAGSLVVYRTNASQSWADGADATFTAPAGVTFTSVSDNNNTCTVVDSTHITCAATGYGPGNNPVTIGFTVDPSATPNTTLNVRGWFTDRTNTDPDHSNDQNVALAIQVAPVVGTPLADPMVAGGLLFAGGLALLAVVAVRRRRSRAHA